MGRKNYTFGAGLIGLFLLMMGAGLALFGTRSLIRMWAWERLTLKNASEAMSRWVHPPQPISMKVYIFNVTNPEAVSEGALPILSEVGPYVYEQSREKVNIMQLDNYTLSYQLRNIIKFKQSHSGRLKESDLVTILNVPLAIFAATNEPGTSFRILNALPSRPIIHSGVELREAWFSHDQNHFYLLPFKQGAILSIYETVPEFVGVLDGVWQLFYPGQENIFITTTVKNILFDGITIDCTSKITEVYVACRGLETRKSYSVRKEGKNFKFSFFYAKNGTSPETYQVYQGIFDLKKSAQYYGMNHSPSLNMWKNHYCDMINGSDGAQFPVNVDKTQRLYIFEKELCRSVYTEFEKEVTRKGVKLYKFTNTESLFASPEENPDNSCFCRSPLSLRDLVGDVGESETRGETNDPNICFQNGILPLMPCVGAPIVASFPHFYLGDQSYVNYSGLSPNKELHETYVYVEPISGMAVKGFKRIQLNLELKRIFDVQITSRLIDGLFPILWVEEGMELAPDFFKLLRYTLIEKTVLEYGTFALIGIGLLLIAVAYAIRVVRERQARCTKAINVPEVYPHPVRARLGIWQKSKGIVIPSDSINPEKSNEFKRKSLIDNFIQ